MHNENAVFGKHVKSVNGKNSMIAVLRSCLGAGVYGKYGSFFYRKAASGNFQTL